MKMKGTPSFQKKLCEPVSDRSMETRMRFVPRVVTEDSERNFYVKGGEISVQNWSNAYRVEMLSDAEKKFSDAASVILRELPRRRR